MHGIWLTAVKTIFTYSRRRLAAHHSAFQSRPAWHMSASTWQTAPSVAVSHPTMKRDGLSRWGGMNVIRDRQLLRALLLPGSLLLGLGAQARAQDAHEHMDMSAQAPVPGVRETRWSDPASWPDGKVPGAGAAVTIGRDRNVVLVVAPRARRSLTINGKLCFANDRDLELKTDWIYVAGG